MPARSKPAKPAKKPLPTDKKLPKLLSLEKVGETLDLSETSVKRLIKTGQIRGFKVASVWRVSEHDLWVYLRTARAQGGKSAPAPKAFEPVEEPEPRQPELPHTEVARAV